MGERSAIGVGGRPQRDASTLAMKAAATCTRRSVGVTSIPALAYRVRHLERTLARVVKALQGLQLDTPNDGTLPLPTPTPPPSPVQKKQSAAAAALPPPPPPPPSPPPASLLFFDLETTGLKGGTSHVRIREVAVVPHATCRADPNPFRRAVAPGVPVERQALATAPDPPDAATAEPWSVVGRAFNAYIASFPAPRVLAGFYSKRYDSRILMFEHRRHGLTWPPDTHFVDFYEVLPRLTTLDTPRRLGRYHAHVLGRPLTNAHTALGDAQGLRDIATHLGSDGDDPALPILWPLVVAHWESVDAVQRRCRLTVDPSGRSDGGGGGGGGDDE